MQIIGFYSFMNNSKIIGSNSGEPWIGLLDGTYAIVLTLLVIELPALIIELVSLIEEGISVVAVSSAIAKLIMGYLFATILIYDLWALHKGFKSLCVASRFSSIFTMVILWLGSLIPPSIYLVQHYSQRYSISEILDKEEILTLNFEIILIRFFEIGLFVIIYLLLLALFKNEIKSSLREDNKFRKELSDTAKIISYRVLASLTLLIISLFVPTGLLAELPLALLALFTLMPSDLYGKKLIST